MISISVLSMDPATATATATATGTGDADKAAMVAAMQALSFKPAEELVSKRAVSIAVSTGKARHER